MSESTASRPRPEPPLRDDANSSTDVAENVAMPTYADARGKRLRNAIIMANLAVWVIVLVLAKWLFL
jgi:hypothetical protein